MDNTNTAVSTPVPTEEVNPSAVSPAAEPPEILPPSDAQPSDTPVESVITETSSPKAPSPSQSPLPSPVQLQLPPPPVFLGSISELKGLSELISAFHHCYEDLNNHFDTIRIAISSRLNQETPVADPLVVTSSPSSSKLVATEEAMLQKQPKKTSPVSELEGMCKTMCSRGVRKYLATNRPHLSSLREEVPRALKLAPNPPKLVLECSGKFFLQGSKAYTKDSPMIPAREASIFVLECYLLMMGDCNLALDIEKSVKEEADSAALAWKKRLVAEGGVSKANQIDARGLLLFVACFGIPDTFKREDIRDLVIAANDKEVVSLLKNSKMLTNKIPEIVEWMIKNKMEVDAVDIVYTFGLEEKFDPQTILSSFIRESEEKKLKAASQGTTVALTESNNRKQLAALRSIHRCLEKHKVDSATLLPEWQISEMIASLEKELPDSDKKPERTAPPPPKRKVTDAESSKRFRSQDAKRPRRGQHHPKPGPPHVDRGRRNTGLPDHTKNYSAAPSVVYAGPGAGLLPESLLQPGVGSAVLPANHSGIHPAGSYHNIQGQVAVDNHGAQPYMWHGETAMHDARYAAPQPASYGLATLYRAPTSVEGFAGAPNASTVVGVAAGRGAAADLYQFADTVVDNQVHPGSVPHMAPSTAVAPQHHSSYLYQA